MDYTVTNKIQKSCDWANQIKEMNSINFLFVQIRIVKFLMRECNPNLWICDGCLVEKKRAWMTRLTLKRFLNLTILIPSDLKGWVIVMHWWKISFASRPGGQQNKTQQWQRWRKWLPFLKSSCRDNVHLSLIHFWFEI